MVGAKTCALLAALLLVGCQAQTISESIEAARNGGSAATSTAATATPAEDSTAITVEAAAPTEADAAAPAVSNAASLGVAATPSKAYTGPLAKYLSSTNASFYSITWLALEAANLAESLNADDLAITLFAPTNAAWEKRLPTLTKSNDISAHDLFSVGKADALRGIMQYHMTASVLKSAKAVKGALSTASNLCSNAKDLKAVQSGGAIQLQSAGGTHAYILDKGQKLGVKGQKAYSTLYPIDDVLLPDVVTVPLNIALQAYTAEVAVLAPYLQADAPAIDQLDETAAEGPLAPTYAQPADPVAGGAISSASTATATGASSAGR